MNYEIKVNKSYSKTFSKRAFLPRYVLENFSPRKSVLDYGAGKDAFGTILLRDHGFKCTAYDVGDNVFDIHSTDALMEQYDIIMASNVMNVQSDEMEMQTILIDIIDCLKPGGVFLYNYPPKPRYSDVSNVKFLMLLKEYFDTVNVLRVNNNLLYECRREIL